MCVNASYFSLTYAKGHKYIPMPLFSLVLHILVFHSSEDYLNTIRDRKIILFGSTDKLIITNHLLISLFLLTCDDNYIISKY